MDRIKHQLIEPTVRGTPDRYILMCSSWAERHNWILAAFDAAVAGGLGRKKALFSDVSCDIDALAAGLLRKSTSVA